MASNGLVSSMPLVSRFSRRWLQSILDHGLGEHWPKEKEEHGTLAGHRELAFWSLLIVAARGWRAETVAVCAPTGMVKALVPTIPLLNEAPG